MLIELIRWWYSAGWLKAAKNVKSWPQGVLRHFSVPILVRTLFSPWRRIVTPPGRSFDTRVRAALDNFISRIIGSIVRVLVLLASAVIAFAALALAFVLVITWPLMPACVVGLVIKGITG